MRRRARGLFQERVAQDLCCCWREHVCWNTPDSTSAWIGQAVTEVALGVRISSLWKMESPAEWNALRSTAMSQRTTRLACPSADVMCREGGHWLREFRCLSATVFLLSGVCSVCRSLRIEKAEGTRSLWWQAVVLPGHALFRQQHKSGLRMVFVAVEASTSAGTLLVAT